MNKKVLDIIEMVDDLKDCQDIISASVQIKSNKYVKVLEVKLETEKDARNHLVYLDSERYDNTPEQNLENLYDLLAGIIDGSRDRLDMICGSRGYQKKLFA